MKKISILTPCYNEQENVDALISKVRKTMALLVDRYEYEFIFIDNCSTDGTVDALKKYAKDDDRIKIIVNTRNFGHIRSPHYGLLQTTGDCVVLLVADLQDPPELISEFVEHWEHGYKIVAARKTKSREHPVMYFLRGVYYKLLGKFSDIPLLEQFMGFGLYDKCVIDVLRELNEPYPYFRGLISDVGFEIKEVEYTQNKRKDGETKNNFYTLFDMAMLGFTNHTKIPLRLATLTGFFGAFVSLLVGVVYLVYKLLFWNSISVGIAPLVIGLFFAASIQLFFLGVVGEYVGSIFTYVQNRPLVIEKERINFK